MATPEQEPTVVGPQPGLIKHEASVIPCAIARPHLLIEDTDVVMTAAWFRMLHGHRDPVLSAMPAVAELYLLFAPDTPWVADGTRQFVGRDRLMFQAAIEDEMAARNIEPVLIMGNWLQREAQANAALTHRLDSLPQSAS